MPTVEEKQGEELPASDTGADVVAEIERELERDWKDEIKEAYINMLAADRACGMARIERQRQREEALVDHVRGLAGVEKKPAEGEDMATSVNVGNREIHYHAASKSQSSLSGTNGEAKSSTLAASAGTSLLGKAALSAALLGGGSGLGYVASNLLSDPPAAVVSEDTDTDSTLAIDFPDPQTSIRKEGNLQ